jgi:hypothetical protein
MTHIPADATTEQEPLARARRRDTARRRIQVHNAIAEQITAGAEITASSIARVARVHRSFIHRHQDLHAAVLTAAAVPAEPASSNSAGSVASLPAPTCSTPAHTTSDCSNTSVPWKTGSRRPSVKASSATVARRTRRHQQPPAGAHRP